MKRGTTMIESEKEKNEMPMDETQTLTEPPSEEKPQEAANVTGTSGQDEDTAFRVEFVRPKKGAARKGVFWASTLIFVLTSTAAYVNAGILYALYDIESAADTSSGTLDSAMTDSWIVFLSLAAVMIASFVFAVMNVGERDEQGKMKLNWFDKIFLEIDAAMAFMECTLLIVCMNLCLGVIYHTDFSKSLLSDVGLDRDYFGSYFSDFNPYWLEIFITLLFVICLSIVSLATVLSVIKKIKGRCLAQNSLIVRVIRYFANAFKESEHILLKVIAVLVIGAILSATGYGLIAVLILIFVFAPKYVKKYMEVRKGVAEVRRGNLEYKIPVTSNGELDRMAMDINEISGASSVAIQNELKNQRMKTDLISNVSHDLKTPLTSMVTYVDLLKKEGLDSPDAPQYLNIIDEKTRRLQKLTEDLFEAAKASSGAIPVNIERIDMESIVNQALAELEGRIDQSGLDVIVNAKTEDTFVMADGQHLWRVIENLLVNACKYSVPGSRVYMDITDAGSSLLLEVKNISKDPLNISADELMERFTRGDSSRNTEGSGLGLAIAKDLTSLMNGTFSLSIDGDLFKASIMLPKA